MPPALASVRLKIVRDGRWQTRLCCACRLFAAASLLGHMSEAEDLPQARRAMQSLLTLLVNR